MNVRTRLAVAAVLLAGIGMAAVPAGATAAAQTKFVNDVRFLDPDASGVSNKTIMSLGSDVCDDLKSGTSVKTLAEVLTGSEKAVVVSAASDLCPKYKAKVASYYASTSTTIPRPALTQQQKSALSSAKQYLALEGFSQQGLIDQLDSPDGGQYSVNDATVAVHSLNENWNNEAVQSAKSYMKLEPKSCDALIAQLDSPDGGQFTQAQATYGAQQAGDCG
jgi:Host cell surface-exposed lipoprotein